VNFDPLPDADNAAVGSQNDFFRRHCQTQCLIFSQAHHPGDCRKNPEKAEWVFEDCEHHFLIRQQCSVQLGAPLLDAI